LRWILEGVEESSRTGALLAGDPWRGWWDLVREKTEER